jgi:hypothetical protein
MPYYLIKTPDGFGVVSYTGGFPKFHSYDTSLINAKAQLRILNSLLYKEDEKKAKRNLRIN